MPNAREELSKEFVYDFAVSGGAVGAIVLGALPKFFVPSSCLAIAETALTSGGSATVELGSTTTADQLLASSAFTGLDTIGKVLGGAAHSLSQLLVANDLVLAMTIGTAALTAGKVRFVVKGYLPSNATPQSVG